MILVYIVLRVMGLAKDEGSCNRCWVWFDEYRVVEILTWGKFWFVMLSLYDYEGFYLVIFEIWLLFEWVFVYLCRFYCHIRFIYLGFSYFYGK